MTGSFPYFSSTAQLLASTANTNFVCLYIRLCSSSRRLLCSKRLAKLSLMFKTSLDEVGSKRVPPETSSESDVELSASEKGLTLFLGRSVVLAVALRFLMP